MCQAWTTEGLIFMRKEIDLGEYAEVINEEEKIDGTTKGNNWHGSTEIKVDNG